MHLITGILCFTAALALNVNVVASADERACEEPFRACVQGLIDVGVGGDATIAQFLQQGIKAVCRTLEEIEECLDGVTGTGTCKRYTERMLSMGWENTLTLYDLVCEKYVEEIEENWQCIVDILDPAVSCAYDNKCNYGAATSCSDDVVSRSAKCSTDVQELVQTLVKKYMVLHTGCTEDKEECHIPANHCLQAFSGFDLFDDGRKSLNLGIERICSGILSDIQCFQEVEERADCGFFPQSYFDGSHTAFVNLISFVCEDKARRDDIAGNWSCLSAVAKDLVRCTGKSDHGCRVDKAMKCASHVLNKSRQCKRGVTSLVRELIKEKMVRFDECSVFDKKSIDFKQTVGPETEFDVGELSEQSYFGINPCPIGFIHFGNSPGCYKILSEALTYDQAYQKCSVQNPAGRLATVESAGEHRYIQNYLSASRGFNWAPCNSQFWIGLERYNRNDCSNRFYWKKRYGRFTFQEAMGFSAFAQGEPNCHENTKEGCVQYTGRTNYQWNDFACDRKICALCEAPPSCPKEGSFPF